MVPETLAAFDDGVEVRRRWWESTPRMILLLAIGPAIFAIAMATARKPLQYEPQRTTNTASVKIVSSWVLKDRSIPGPGEMRVGQTLMTAATLFVTILVHGAAAISVGLGLTIARGWSKRTLAAAIGLTLFAVFILPLYLLVLNGSQNQSLGMWSFVIASESLLSLLFTHRADASATLRCVIVWDMVVALSLSGFSGRRSG